MRRLYEFSATQVTFLKYAAGMEAILGTISWRNGALRPETPTDDGFESCLSRYFPDNPQFVANSSHTPPPMEEISLCGHPTALI